MGAHEKIMRYAWRGSKYVWIQGVNDLTFSPAGALLPRLLSKALQISDCTSEYIGYKRARSVWSVIRQHGIRGARFA
ncbi:hypothetical protein XENTR_v10013339 [Xenopus tropicalis]|nr:hypothetical protein XENTR_v10013339 [Xenopus tropicalis]